MRVGLDDIDPDIAQRVADRLCAPSEEFLKEDIYWGGLMAWRLNWQPRGVGLRVKRKRQPGEDERRAYELSKKREEQVVLRAFITIFLPLILGLIVGTGLTGVTGFLWPGLLGGLLVWIAALTAGVRFTLKATPRMELRRHVQLAEMRAVFPLLTLTRAERVYCDTLLLLTRIEAGHEAEPTLRDTLRQLNSLLLSSRQLESRRLSLLPVLGSHSVSELESEYGTLGRRLDACTDDVARQSLQQSLQMCATRLENARVFERTLERLKVQQEAIVQTLASAQSALARMQIAPDPNSALAAQEITETVSQMNRQTYAVEQAVQEVMTLRGQ